MASDDCTHDFTARDGLMVCACGAQYLPAPERAIVEPAPKPIRAQHEHGAWIPIEWTLVEVSRFGFSVRSTERVTKLRCGVGACGYVMEVEHA